MNKLMPTPRSVNLELTCRCNLRCRYCYYFSNEGVHYTELSTARWLAFFDELGAAKVLTVCLSGGEALLRPDIFELIDGVVRNHMRFQLLTNGKPVTPEVAAQLKATNRCDAVQVSLDGAHPEPHEVMRGKGSFAPALAAIRTLKAAGLPVTVRATIHAHNVDELPALAALLLDEIGLPSFSTNAISSLGTHAKYGDALFLSPALRLRAMHILADLDARYPERIQATAGPLAEWKTFHAMETARQNGAVLAGRGRLTGCGCIFTRLAVRADGAYIPCVMLPQMVLGYVGKDALVEVWRSALALNTLRSRRTLTLDTFEECHDCAYRQLCTGNCPGNAYSVYTDANRPAPDGCLRSFQAALAAEGLSLW